MQIFAKKKGGFTLIELLVVIAIIGILAGIVLVSLGGARSKARDAKRQSDIRQIATAQEMIYGDTEAYQTGAVSTIGTPAIGTYLDALIDPQGTAKGYNWLANTTCNQAYCAYATLENGTNKYFAVSQKGTKALVAAPTDGCACF